MPSSNNKRIAKNTLLYIRMFLVMAVTLYISRGILDKLGISDYGIYNVVGGIIAMLGSLSGAMDLDGARHGEKVNWHDSNNLLIRKKFIQSRWSQGDKFKCCNSLPFQWKGSPWGS